MKNWMRINCEVANLKKVRTFVEQSILTACREGLDTQVLTTILLAIDEICANIIIHANAQDPNKELEVGLEIQDGQLIVEAIDEGRPFNRGGYQAPTTEELFQRRKRGGMGLMLVSRVMDEVTFERGPNANIVRMRKQLNLGKGLSEESNCNPNSPPSTDEQTSLGGPVQQHS